MSSVNEIPSGWEEINIGKLGRTITGKTPSKSNPDDWGDVIDFITPSEIDNSSKFIFNTPRKLSKQGFDRFSRMILPSKSVIVTCIGSDMGKVVMNKNQALTNQQINSIVIDDKHYNDYVFYLLKNAYRVLRRNAEGSGSTMPILNKSNFESLAFLIPKNIKEQKAIANVLSAFDDKIENLRAQNKTLEQTAQTIFKEWFGQHQIDDELPDGWQVRNLDKIAEHLKDNIKPFNKPEKQFIHYSLPAFDNGLRPVKENGTEIKSNKYSVIDTSFLVSKLNPFTPRIWTIYKAEENHICSTEFQVVKPRKDIYFSLIHCFLNSTQFTSELSQKVKGTSSSHQRVNPKDIFDVKLIIPEEEALIKFNKIVDSMILKKNVNHQQIQTLTQTRDTLLPKLMRGKLRVNGFKK
ncbi:MAG: restriction endonuclease subunit S [Psychroflexus halocasei]